jgi:hypothetical protein
VSAPVVSPLPTDQSVWTIEGHIIIGWVYIDLHRGTYDTRCWALAGRVDAGFVRLYDGSFSVCPLCALAYEEDPGR